MLPPGDTWLGLHTFWVVTPGRGQLLAPSGQRPGRLPDILQGTKQPLMTKDDLVQNVHGEEAGQVQSGVPGRCP